MALWNGKLTEIVMTARDPAAAAEYWADLFGGRVDGGAAVLSGGTRIEVVEGPAEALAEQRFEAGPELMAAADAASALAGADGRASLTDPDGWLLGLIPVDEVAPLAADGAALSHCTLGSPDPPVQRAFYEGLTFLLSDQLGEIFCWLRPNAIHHSLAFTLQPEPNIHHIALELPDRASFIGAIDRLVERDHKLEFGPGRHMVGGNLFAYFRDRHGLRWELCAELDRLPADSRPGLFSAEDRARSVNTFGPPPPPAFIREPGGPAPARALA